MTLNELRSEIKLARPEWDDRYVIHTINTNRALYLKNKLNQGMHLNDVTKQTLLNVEMIVVSNAEATNFVSSGRLLRTKDPLPSLVATKTSDGYLSVRLPMITSEDFNVVPIEDLRYKGNGRYNQRKAFCSLYDGNLYIKLNRTNPKLAMIDTLSIEGIFEDPLDAMAYNDPSLIGRDFWFREYPMNSADWIYVRNMILGNEEET